MITLTVDWKCEVGSRLSLSSFFGEINRQLRNVGEMQSTPMEIIPVFSQE